uniref:DNA polymerase n=3 Tax=Parascaris univalens TaxID=6257 RepID=A0A915BCS9_PARUN
EDPMKFPGTVYLFGRVINKSISESCCIIVRNIWRRVFFLPRETRFSNGIDSGEKVDFLEVNNEVQTLLRQIGVSTVKCRPTKRNFAFNDGVIPKSAEVLEVQYSSTFPKLSTEMKGDTFSHVFNTTATAMERLLLEVDMRGPSWMEITDYVVSSPQQSYAKHEFIVDMERMKSLRVVECGDPMPTVTLMAINFTTTMSDKKENEITMISFIVDSKCNLNKPTTVRNKLERYCLLTKSSHRALPFDLQQRLKEARIDTRVFEASNERHLLSQFLCRLQEFDPDVLLGHDMPTQLSILVARLEKLKIAQWSRTSRLKRSLAIKQLGRSKSAHWELTAGRLVVDSRSSAMELVKSRSYDLDELASNLLGIVTAPRTLDSADSFLSSTRLIRAINQSWQDAWIALAIIAELNALPLFVQITQTVGGVLSRTLMGGRAERNEFLLLHAFQKANYVPPNKHQYEHKRKPQSADKAITEDEQEERSDEKSSKKAQYMGGLVLEPKKGLYDKYVLLLDFNSLYPSIIQEYNICFTTVDQSKGKDESEVPELPSDKNEGILPREIRVLVERRRDVKKLMSSEKLSEHQRQQYNIRQMALKLTANSMYGCLGFIHSRFYAKPLAALITSRGREILMHTKDLVEKQGYAVIYGDTDSIMINTGLEDLEQVKKLGLELKRMVNKCHKRLELDIDGVYKRLLLLKKKKYAGLAVDLNDSCKVKREMKGLDIVRRDWSVLAKDIGNEVVDMILSFSLGREELVERIHDRLRSLRQELDEGLIDISKYEILKQLTRDPSEYADIKAQPHAAVARRLNASGKFHFHRGDTVSYIICEDGSGNSAAQRAYHKSEIASRNELTIDTLYYLAHQIHPVVCRLCEPIEETDAVQIAEALGLDSSGYRSHALVNEYYDDSEDFSLGLNYDFSRCRPFTFTCPYDGCHAEIEIRETLQGEELDIGFCLGECQKCKRSLIRYGVYLINRLHLAQNSAIEEYYTSNFVCEDIVCAYRTRMHVLSWSREGVHCPRCHLGIMRREKSARMLFEQQSFFRSLFDLPKAISECKPEQQKKLKTCRDAEKIFALHASLLGICDEYLSRNDFNRVSLAYLFASMRTGA